VTRDEALRRYGSCLRNSPCDAYYDETVFGACWDQMLAEITPSPACEQYCEGIALSVFECAGAYSVDECLTRGACSWTDQVLSSATECTRIDDCEASDACIESAFSIP
jgi:hypothetical protein